MQMQMQYAVKASIETGGAGQHSFTAPNSMDPDSYSGGWLSASEPAMQSTKAMSWDPAIGQCSLIPSPGYMYSHSIFWRLQTGFLTGRSIFDFLRRRIQHHTEAAIAYYCLHEQAEVHGRISNEGEIHSEGSESIRSTS